MFVIERSQSQRFGKIVEAFSLCHQVCTSNSYKVYVQVHVLLVDHDHKDLSNPYSILYTIAPMASNFGFIHQTLAMVTCFKYSNCKQGRSLRIMVQVIHHYDNHWNEVIEPLSISRSTSKIYARI